MSITPTAPASEMSPEEQRVAQTSCDHMASYLSLEGKCLTCGKQITKPRMNILQDYLESEIAAGKIDFRIRAQKRDGVVEFYIHPLSENGQTADFYAVGNAVFDKRVVDKISPNAKEAIQAIHDAVRNSANDKPTK